MKPTKKAYTNFYEQSKFDLIWNFGIALAILLSVVSILNYTNNSYSIWPNVTSVFICVLSLIVLHKTKKYKTVAYFSTFFIFALISSTYFILVDILHYTTPLWMILNILLAFFTLGKRWGSFLLICHFIVLFIYIFYRMDDNLRSIPEYNTADLFNFILEISIVAFGIYYILSQYIKTTNYALDQEKLVNNELKKNNDLIQKQNQEKEVMLREIHHRVKNNLQIITSILRLQSHGSNNNYQDSSFKEAINRVESIAIIHEIIYKQDFATNFDLEKYFQTLTQNVIDNYNFEKKVGINVKSKLTCVQCSSIVPIAILLNELVTNSFKHAFDDVEKPHIDISMESIDEKYYELIYTDNGLWKEGNPSSFGTEMIETVTEQLDGDFKIDKLAAGTKYTFNLQHIEE